MTEDARRTMFAYDIREACDLAERLGKYRSRLVQDGRNVGLGQLDRAIEEALRLGRAPRIDR